MNDKRALKRAYLDAPTRAGVFAIRHRASGRVLVDGSANAQASLTRHAFELRMRMHRNRALQRDWDEDGEAGLVFEVLDGVKPDPEPGVDPARALRTLVDLWCAELGMPAPGVYGPAATTATTTTTRAAG